MFVLITPEIRGRMHDCGAGPAPLNAEATVEGHRVVSRDPLCRFAAGWIRTRVEQTSRNLLANVGQNTDRFRPGPGRIPGRTQADPAGSDGPFSLRPSPGPKTAPLPKGRSSSPAVSVLEHFLDGISPEAIREMCRVAGETRVFPLLGAYGKPSPHLGPVIRQPRDLGSGVGKRRVPYGLLRVADEMLSVTAP